MLFKIYFALLILWYLDVYASDCMEKPHCGVNEVWDYSCLPPLTCDDPCGTRDGPHVCPLGPDGNCVKKCVCRPGFVRDSSGRCTHCTQCTHLDEDDCCDDEEFQSCGTFCPETCASRGKTVTCTEHCVKGCFCKKGHVRDINGICVDPEECPGMGGGDDNEGEDEICEKGCNGDPNAHPGCGVNCGRTCATFKNPPKICPRLCMLHGCDCNDGFVKDENLNICVKPNDCTPICGINETFSQDPVICPPQTCDAQGKGFSCPANTTGPPACICKEGSLRNKENKCVLKADCDKGVKNETYTECGSDCEYTCANYGDRFSCPAVCVKGYFCNKGYHRNDTGQCVLLKDCPPRKCEESEYFSTCGPYCEPYCKDISDVLGCQDKCKYGCFCRKGYYRSNRSDKCVALENCQSACPEGEVFKTCGTACQPYCADPSPVCTKQCSRSCFCPDGYIRKNKKGACIKKGQCPM